MAKKLSLAIVMALISAIFSPAAHADEVTVTSNPAATTQLTKLILDVDKIMEKFGAPLAFTSQDMAALLGGAQELIDVKSGAPFRTKHGRQLPYYVFTPESGCATEQIQTVLMIGGIHGNELSPNYSSWRALLELLHDPSRRPTNTRIVYAPITNPDGFLTAPRVHGAPVRTNMNGVDLNRDFDKTVPEKETQFIKALIDRYHPTHLVALHAPFGWLDYDGPAKQPDADPSTIRKANAWLQQVNQAAPGLPIKSSFGTYSGSLGNYAGNKKHIHTLTVEYPDKSLKHAEQDWRNFGEGVMRSLNPPSL